MGFGSRALMAGGLGFAAAFVVACGDSSSLLSADESSTIASQLSAITQAVNAGSCTQAASAANTLNNTLSDLPPSVNQTLVRNLGQGASTVKALAARDCANASHTTSSTSSTSSSTSSTSSTLPRD